MAVYSGMVLLEEGKAKAKVLHCTNPRYWPFPSDAATPGGSRSGFLSQPSLLLRFSRMGPHPTEPAAFLGGKALRQRKSKSELQQQ